MTILDSIFNVSYISNTINEEEWLEFSLEGVCCYLMKQETYLSLGMIDGQRILRCLNPRFQAHQKLLKEHIMRVFEERSCDGE